MASPAMSGTAASRTAAGIWSPRGRSASKATRMVSGVAEASAGDMSARSDTTRPWPRSPRPGRPPSRSHTSALEGMAQGVSTTHVVRTRPVSATCSTAAGYVHPVRCSGSQARKMAVMDPLSQRPALRIVPGDAQNAWRRGYSAAPGNLRVEKQFAQRPVATTKPVQPPRFREPLHRQVVRIFRFYETVLIRDSLRPGGCYRVYASSARCRASSQPAQIMATPRTRRVHALVAFSDRKLAADPTPTTSP